MKSSNSRSRLTVSLGMLLILLACSTEEAAKKNPPVRAKAAANSGSQTAKKKASTDATAESKAKATPDDDDQGDDAPPMMSAGDPDDDPAESGTGASSGGGQPSTAGMGAMPPGQMPKEEEPKVDAPKPEVGKPAENKPKLVNPTGTLTVKYALKAPATRGDHFDKGHVRAAWITTQEATPAALIKTLEVTGPKRSVHLGRWAFFTKAGNDAKTGATGPALSATAINSTLTWDFKDKAGALVGFGKYNLWLEVATGNSVALGANAVTSPVSISKNGAGYAYLIVPFVLTEEGGMTMKADDPVFTNISIAHVPK